MQGPMIASDILKRRNLEHTTWIEGGIVSSRVALLLRSAEIKPLFFDLIPGGVELRVVCFVVWECWVCL